MCVMSVFFAGEGQAHHRQLVDDLFERLAAEVAHLHHVVLGLGDQILDGVDVGALEAVEAAHGQVELLDGELKHLVALRLRLLDDGGAGAHRVAQVGEEREVVAEDLGAQRHGVTRGDRAVRPDLKRQLVKVGHVAHAGVLHRVVDLVDGGVDRIHRDRADDVLRGLVAVGGDIAAAVAERDLHVQCRAGVQRRDVQIRVEDLHLAVALDVARRDLAGARRLDVDGLDGLRAVELGDQALDVEHDLRHVLLDAGDGGELVLHTRDLDRGSRRAGQGREHDAAQRVSERDAVAALQRLDHILAVSAVFGVFNALDLGLLNFNQSSYPPSSICGRYRPWNNAHDEGPPPITSSTTQRSGAPRSAGRCPRARGRGRPCP